MIVLAYYAVIFLIKISLSLLCLLILFLITIKTSYWCHDFTCTCKSDLTGKTVIITGGNDGIGFETAKGLAQRGARLVIASRNVAKSQEAVKAIIKATGNHNVEYRFLDLGKLSSIKQFADDFNKSHDRLDVLINNSGTPDQGDYLTEDGIDGLWQINHVGPTYLTKLLLDKLILSKPSRIIFVASIVYTASNLDPDDITGSRNSENMTKYANSKFANMLITRALSRILPEGVTVNSLHPGTGATDIFDPKSKRVKKILLTIIEWIFMSVKECAQASIHLASSPSLASVSGMFFDEFKMAECPKMVTDELAEKVWNATMNLIDDRTNFRHKKVYS